MSSQGWVDFSVFVYRTFFLAESLDQTFVYCSGGAGDGLVVVFLGTHPRGLLRDVFMVVDLLLTSG